MKLMGSFKAIYDITMQLEDKKLWHLDVSIMLFNFTYHNQLYQWVIQKATQNLFQLTKYSNARN